MIFTDGEKDIFRKRPRPKVSHWATMNIIVPDGPYAGGRYRKDVNPYLVGIMDAWGERHVSEVSVCGAPQVGKTLLLYSCLAYSVDYRPAPRMLAMPNDDTMKTVLSVKLQPLLKKCRSISKKFRRAKGREISFTDSTSIYLSSAASPSQRASLSIQDLFMDEEALYAKEQGKGDPVTDFLERTNSYKNTSKVLRISKPVGHRSSIVDAVENADEKREYFCCCPACGVYQIMEEGGIVLKEEIDDVAKIEREKLGRYKCNTCGFLWNDVNRDLAVKNGYWASLEPVENPQKLGFHLPGVLSTAVSLSRVAGVKKLLESSDDQEIHQGYWNGFWALPYSKVVKKTSTENLVELIDPELAPQVCPPGTQFLTVGVDMQKRGFYFVVMAWDRKIKGTVIDYGRMRDFDDLYRLIYEISYPLEGENAPMVLFRGLLDSGGGRSDDADVTRTEQAYAFVSQYGMQTLHLAKGASHKQVTPIRQSVLEKMPRSGKAIAGGLHLNILDTDYFKTLVVAKLSADAVQPVTFHRDCDELFFKQITAEELVLERGKRVWRMKKGQRDNHYFDCLCLNFACVHQSFYPSVSMLIGADSFDFENKGEVTSTAPQSQKPKTKPRPKQGGGSLW